jgi:protein-S-isoprenylcysteine O-methyltransferase Ste14
MNERHLISLALGGYLLIALVWPALRTWLRTGVFPVVLHREATGFQRALGMYMALFVTALGGWCALLAVGGVDLALWSVPTWLLTGGWVLFGLGTLLTVAAQLGMGASWRVGIDDRPTALVTGGLFRCVRNPIFSGMFLTLTGIVLLAPSPWSIMGLFWAVSLVAIQTRLEEQHLEALHGDAYRAYARRTGRFVPRLGRLADSNPAGEAP